MISYIPAFIIASLIAILHYLGIANKWYEIFIWYDVLLHILGGFWVGYTVCYLWLRNMRGNSNDLFWVALVGVLVVGLGWEVFEYIYNIADPYNSMPYLVDTSKDIVMDICGALLAWGYIAKNMRGK